MSRHGRFAFPYPPYHTQEGLMTAIYSVIRDRRVGVFESPTGTGKTLCIISAVLTWLRESYARDAAGDASEDDEVADTVSTETCRCSGESHAPTAEQPEKFPTPSWIISASDRERQRKREQRAHMAVLRAKRRDAVARRLCASAQKRAQLSRKRVFVAAGDDEACSRLVALKPPVDDVSDTAELLVATKILFCSRTHSQLAQFLQELRKSPLSAGVRVATIASRSLLCVNDEVLALKSDSAINETCLQLQDQSRKGASSSSSRMIDHDGLGDSGSDSEIVAGGKPALKRKQSRKGCDFFGAEKASTLADVFLSDPVSIEDCGSIGKKMGACPYYGSKVAVSDAEIVLMPYTVLLHHATRESYGFTAETLSRCVVVLDEAHNVIDAISNMHSCTVTLPQLSACSALISAYLTKYTTRMSSTTVRWLSSFSVFVSSMAQYLSHPTTTSVDGSMQLLPEFIANCHLNTLDFVGLEKFVNESGLGRKLRGFDRVVLAESGGEGVGSYHACVAFLSALLTVESDGRILVKAVASVSAGRSKPPFVKFCLLNPGSRFRPVVAAARSVVLIGGTLQPVQGLISQLLPDERSERVVTHSCGHVVSASQVLGIALSRGPCSDTPFNFTHSKRDDPSQLLNLGQTLVNCVTIVPKGSGCVVFFPSYDFEELCWTHWATLSVAASIEKHCQVFREPRGSSDSPLEEYSRCIASGRKALLSCVVGGKMSEGINFSDELARLVFVVGLPYASKTDPELRARMAYLDHQKSVASVGPLSLISGEEYYRDLCMKAVNQSIGRSIRHAKDFAAIVLCDERYDHPDIKCRLPTWIVERSLRSFPTFGPAFAALRGFYSVNCQASKATAV